MPHKKNRPNSEVALPDWFERLSAGIGKYGASLGVSAQEITDAQANCAFGAAVLRVQLALGEYTQGMTRFKNAALYATDQCTAWPTGFTLPANLAAVSHAGVIPLLSLLIGRMKKHSAYTKQIGEEMGIEGADQTADPSAIAAKKPVLNVVITSAGHPLIKWPKGEMEGIEIWADRGDGKGYGFAYHSSHPDTLDTYPLPAPGTSAVWKYKAIYRLYDQQTGQWSDEVKISVMGQ